ncbi:hypothetical protein M569_12926, partial [Genlisea aurea]
SRKQLGHNNASGPGRPSSGGMPSKNSSTPSAKVQAPVTKNRASNVPKPPYPQSGGRNPNLSHGQQQQHRSVPANGQSSAVIKSSVMRKETTKPTVGGRKEILPPSKD